MGYYHFDALFEEQLQANSFTDAVVATGVAGRIAHQFENMLFLDHFLHFEDIMIIHHTSNAKHKSPFYRK